MREMRDERMRDRESLVKRTVFVVLIPYQGRDKNDT